jgi:excisionase family DNA binding protein
MPQILAVRAVQRPPQTPTPVTPAHPRPEATDPRTAPTIAHKALYKVSEAMTLLSLSRSVVYELMRAGRLRYVHQGRTRLIPAAAITEYVALLETEADSVERAA